MTDQNLSPLFTFLQMNFWNGRLPHPIRRFLAREKADLFSAQEMLSCAEGGHPGYLLTLDMLLNEGVFHTCARGKPTPWIKVEELNYPVQCASFAAGEAQIRFEKTLLLPTLDNGIGPEDDYYSLLHSIATLEDGSLIHILTYHARLEYEARMGSEYQDSAFKMVADYIATLSGPVIFSGDFNMYKEARSLQSLKAIGLVNLNDVYNISVGRNEFAWKSDEIVSHVYINDQVIVEDYRVAQDNVSDHLPLVMKARVKK